MARWPRCHTHAHTHPFSSVIGVAHVSVVLATLADGYLSALLLVLGDQNSALHQQAHHVQCWEIVLSTQLLKANDLTDFHTVLKEDDRGEHLNIKLLNKEGTLLGVDAHEAALFMLSADSLEVHVHNLAALEVLVEEGDHDVVSLGYRGQELLLCDLLVRAVAMNDVVTLLLECSLFGTHALGCDVAEHLLLLLVHGEIGVFLLLGALALLSAHVFTIEMEIVSD